MQRQQPQILERLQETSEVELLINRKHDQYHARCTWFQILYYVTRMGAGLSAALLPFFVQNNPAVATALSVIALVAIVIDQVLDPRYKWALYSKATDLLMIARLKAKGEHSRYKDLLQIIESTESETVARLVNMEELLNKLKGSNYPM